MSRYPRNTPCNEHSIQCCERLSCAMICCRPTSFLYIAIPLSHHRGPVCHLGKKCSSHLHHLSPGYPSPKGFTKETGTGSSIHNPIDAKSSTNSGAVANSHVKVKRKLATLGTTLADTDGRTLESDVCTKIPTACRRKNNSGFQGLPCPMADILPEPCISPDCVNVTSMATIVPVLVPFLIYPRWNKYVAGARNCTRKV